MKGFCSRTEAEDAVQEAWLRLASADVATIDNVPGWLTTVVSRICLDTLRTRKSRREAPLGADAEAIPGTDDTERNAALEDSYQPAKSLTHGGFPPPATCDSIAAPIRGRRAWAER